MSDELRERVAMVNCAGDQWDKPCKVPCVDCLREADAAIALARAEAADRIAQLEEANELMLTDIRRTDVDMLAFKAEIESLNIRIKELERAVSDGLAAQRRLQRQVHAEWLVDKYREEEDTK
jgi:septal ring factor EnvC (AmiA/AmiB activator)